MAIREFRTSNNSITDRSKESVSIYLREISREDCLSPEEEARLAHIIRKGGEGADAARERLIKANLRFVVSVANQYKSPVLELSDLISEGNIGLIKAAEHFDDTKGFKFISYAVWWIRQTIMAAISDNSATCRLPQNQQKVIRQYRQMQHDIFQMEQRNVSIDEFCEVSGMDRNLVVRVLETANIPVNMDQSVSDDGEATYADFLSSDSATDAELDRESLRIDILDVIDHLLTEREKFVMKHYFGLGCKPMSLEAIAKEIGISRERTRQLKIKILSKIRQSPYASRLSTHLAA